MFYPAQVLASLKSVHETLCQERQKVQQVWDANNVHSSNTLAEVRFTLHVVIWFPLVHFPCWFLICLTLNQQPSAVSNLSQGPPSVADSAAEYFDASDDILCGSSSELSDESGLSDGSTTNSEPEEGHGKYKHVVSLTNDILAELAIA